MENTEPLTTSQPNKFNSPDVMGNVKEDFEDVANKFYARFKLDGNLEDLDNAISNLEEGLKIMPDEVIHKPFLLSKQASQLQERYMEGGDEKCLEEALSHLWDMHRITLDRYPEPDGEGNLAASYGSIGVALSMRFQHLGTFADVQDAIPNLQKAVQFIGSDRDPDRRRIDKSGFLANLGTAFQERFKHVNTSIDYEALKILRERVHLMEADKEALAKLTDEQKKTFAELSDQQKTALVMLTGEQKKAFGELKAAFEELEQAKKNALEDLENAVSNQKDAVDSLQDSDKNKPECLSNLGNALLERFRHLHGEEDLGNAIRNHQKAVQLTPDSDSSKSISLDNLATAFRELFYKNEDLKDLESTIYNQKKAIELTRDNDPNKTDRLTNLSIALEKRFECAKDEKDLQAALLNAEQAANHPSGSPRTRFLAAIQWAKCAESSSLPSISAFRVAINLLPRIAWIGIPFADQRALLAEIGSHVRDAVAAAIKHKQYETAVEWAEHGRSIIWQNLLGLREPLDDLRVSHPELANRLQDISARLIRLSPSDRSLNGTQTTPIRDASAYSSLAIEWDQLLEKVRLNPGFEKFLRPKRFNELAVAANEGPVVILNDHASRCDALVLLPNSSSDAKGSVMNIYLEGFTSDMGKKQLAELNRLLVEAYVRFPTYRFPKNDYDPHNSEFQAILHELWLQVVKPIIDGLAYKANATNPSRIWWCATGSFAFLPIHAAGLYDTGDIGKQLTDYAVSSYTPTLSALLDKSAPIDSEDFQILAVAERSTFRPLEQVEGEVKKVEAFAKTAQVKCLTLIDAEATIERVLQEMKERQWIHFACHGIQGFDDPMKSGFTLHGDKGLELSEIIKQTLPKADFAFLSACETAMGDERLAEESIHLAAGMLFAGYRGVIGSMWSIGDDAAPVVGEEVYSRILKDGKPNRKGAAFALHQAVKKFRDGGGEGLNYKSWLPFIHIGR